MRSKVLVLVLATAVGALAAAAPAGAITFGKPDGNRHPYVGALLADHDPDSPGLDFLCSGTLIAPRVFQTAGHCTDFLAAVGIARDDVAVSFDPAYDEDTAVNTVYTGTYTTHPSFGFSGPGGISNPFDIAVVVLDTTPGIAPARLPRVGLLDELKKSGAIKTARFTAVGYGMVRDDKRTGPHALVFDGIRRFAPQTYLSLQSAWLSLSMQPSTGDGGTCFGDSGGPHFLGGETSNLIISLTVTGDAMCRATDKTYRMDTPWVRTFLETFPGVTYPG
jgi:secreted trypsin-like serine protease